MQELAPGVWHLNGTPRNQLNVYVLGDVLIDSALPFDRKRIMKQIAGRDIAAHALTHAHPDHTGSSHAICKALGVPMWCGTADVEAVETGKIAFGPKHRMLPSSAKHPIARALVEGDEVGGFTVLDTPGHSPGHVSYWRESDKVLICGDVFWGYNPFTHKKGIRKPFDFTCPDPAENRRSAERLAALRPELVCFGHGAPVRDPDALAASLA